VTVPLHGVDIEAVKACYREYYGEWGTACPPEPWRRRGNGLPAGALAKAGEWGLIRFVDDPAAAEGGFLSSVALTGSDVLEVSAYGNSERIVLVARFDNLGKGASGAAIQNMNIVLGADERAGLVV